MSEKLKLKLDALKIDQLGYVYKDARKQAELMENTFGVPEFTFMEQTHHIEYRGRELEYTALLGFSRFFNVQVELIQPISGESAHQEFLDEGKEGLQHVSSFFSNAEKLEEIIEDFKGLGLEIVQYGSIGRRQFAYFDTNDILGLMLELQGPKKKRRNK